MAEPAMAPKARAPRYFGLVPAGGVGTRFGGELPKQYARINDKPLLEHSVQALLADSRIVKVFVVVSEADTMAAELFADQERVQVLAKAGPERVNTVLNGLNCLLQNMWVNETDWVLVHDAARPGLPRPLLANLIDQASEHVAGGFLAVPVADIVTAIAALHGHADFEGASDDDRIVGEERPVIGDGDVTAVLVDDRDGDGTVFVTILDEDNPLLAEADDRIGR